MGIGLIAKFMHLVPEPVSVTAVSDGVDENEYRKLAEKAGFLNAETAIKVRQKTIESHQLREFLAKNGICVYPENKVHRYMHSITPKNCTWLWRPLNHNGGFHNPYSKPIPEVVLMTIVKIRESFPNALFEVTDIEELPKGDPFLRVRIPHTTDSFIIERWDEPKFRM